MGITADDLGWLGLRGAVLQRDDFTCQDCGQPTNEVDHIWPKSLGGLDTAENLRACCRSCNARKGSEPFAHVAHWNYTKADLERVRNYMEVRRNNLDLDIGYAQRLLNARFLVNFLTGAAR